MKKFISLLSLFWIIVTSVSAQNITRLEYSIDSFVAEGNGTALEIPGNSNELNSDFNIDISSLEPGIHTIHFRALNEEGVWSFAAERTFYIPEPPITEGIVTIEYSIDTYKKEGEGEPLILQKGTNSVDSVLNIDISDLEAGIHNIYTRSKNKMGVWSLPVSKSFVIVKPDTTKVENVLYRFYNDNYKGAWMTASVDPARKNVDSLFMVSTAGLDLDQDYTIEFYAKNNTEVRSYSAFLSNVDLQINNAPQRMKDSLELIITANQQKELKMDTLFSDQDQILGDSLIYSLEGLDNSDLLNFTDWSSNSILSFTPIDGNSGLYNFWLKTSDISGESDSIQIMLKVTTETGIEDLVSENRFLIYPNPASDYVNIKAMDGFMAGYKIMLYSTTGKLLYSSNVKDKEYTLSLSRYPQGIYLIVLQNSEFMNRKKLIIH